MRLFLAIELPEEARRHLDRVRGALLQPPALAETVKWVARSNWHITLKFLGEVAPHDLESLSRGLAQVRVEQMQLSAERLVYFPRRGPVRVVGVGVGGDSGRLNALHANIESACEPLGIARDERDFTAHITLGRSRDGERGSGVVSLRRCTLPELFPGPVWETTEFVLVQSTLSSHGSEYQVLRRFGRAF